MFEKNHDILLHPKGATTMPTGIKVLVCDDDAAFCQKMAGSSILRSWISTWAHTAGWNWRAISAA